MKKILYPLLALALGAAGYLLRTRQLAEAIHPDTGLLILALSLIHISPSVTTTWWSTCGISPGR